MKIVSPTQINKLQWAANVREVGNPFSLVIQKMLSKVEIGHGLHLKNEDWILAAPPSNYVSRIAKKHFPDRQYTVNGLANRGGWVVIRTK